VDAGADFGVAESVAAHALKFAGLTWNLTSYLT
jgi:hypothetical protein